MKVALNLPIMRLRCLGCDALSSYIDSAKPRGEVAIDCRCHTEPKLEIVFENAQQQQLTSCPLVLP